MQMRGSKSSQSEKHQLSQCEKNQSCGHREYTRGTIMHDKTQCWGQWERKPSKCHWAREKNTPMKNVLPHSMKRMVTVQQNGAAKVNEGTS